MACRICLEDDNTISVCKCNGTQKYVHLKCVRKWAQQQKIKNCELCQQPYDNCVLETQKEPNFIVFVFSILLSAFHAYLLVRYTKYDPDHVFASFMFSAIFNGLMCCGWAFVHQHNPTNFLKHVVGSTIFYLFLSAILQYYLSTILSVLVYFDWGATFIVFLITVILDKRNN